MRKKRKVFLAAVAVLAFLCTAIVLPLPTVYFSSYKRIVSEQEAEKADCILIFGAGLRPDGSPSKMLAERLDCGYRLYLLGKSDRILVSGDHGTKEYDEVGAMKRYLMEKGVPDDAIFMDHAGFSTYDSLYRAKYIFECTSAVLVTQKYHLYRALYIGKALGIACVGTDAAKVSYRGQTFRNLREAAAQVKDFYKLWRKPPASIMGETIPVSGGGSVTNDERFNEQAFEVFRMADRISEPTEVAAKTKP